LPQFSRVGLTKLQSPAPDYFVGQLNSSLGEQIFDIAKAEGKSEIQPDCMLDDLRREAMAAIADSSHLQRLTPHHVDGIRFYVTMPRQRYKRASLTPHASDGKSTQYALRIRRIQPADPLAHVV